MLVLQPCNVASVFIEPANRQPLKDEPRHGIDLRVAQVRREIFGVDFGASDGLVHLAFDGEVGAGRHDFLRRWLREWHRIVRRRCGWRARGGEI